MRPIDCAVELFLPGIIRQIAFTPDGTQILGVGSTGVHCVEVQRASQSDPVHFEHGHAFVRSLAISRDGRILLSGDNAGRLALWDLERSKRLRRIQFTREGVKGTHSSPGIESIALGSGVFVVNGLGRLKVGESEHWEMVAEPELDPILGDLVMTNHELLIGGNRAGSPCRRISLSDFSELGTLDLITGRLLSVDSYGRRVAGVSEDGRSIHIISGGKNKGLLAQFPIPEDFYVDSMALSPEGRFLLACFAQETESRHRVPSSWSLWDVDRRVLLYDSGKTTTKRIRLGWVSNVRVAWSPDGERFALCSEGGHVRVYPLTLFLQETEVFSGGLVQRFQELQDALKNHPEIMVLNAHVEPGASQEHLDALAERLGAALDASLVDFYRQANGMSLAWIAKEFHDPYNEAHKEVEGLLTAQQVADADDAFDGCICLPPLEEVLFGRDGSGETADEDLTDEETRDVGGAQIGKRTFAEALHPFDAYDPHEKAAFVLLPDRKDQVLIAIGAGDDWTVPEGLTFGDYISAVFSQFGALGLTRHEPFTGWLDKLLHARKG